MPRCSHQNLSSVLILFSAIFFAGTTVFAFEYEAEKNYAILTNRGEIVKGRFVKETQGVIFIQSPHGLSAMEIRKTKIVDIALLDPVEGEKSASWTDGRIAVSAIQHQTSGIVRTVLPTGMGGAFTFDQGFDGLLGGGNFWHSGLRLETGYLRFTGDRSELSGFNVLAGPILLLNFFPEKYGQLMVAGLVGATAYHARGISVDERYTALSFSGTLGYEFFIGRIGIFLQARYNYIHDAAALSSIGAASGVMYRMPYAAFGSKS